MILFISIKHFRLIKHIKSISYKIFWRLGKGNISPTELDTKMKQTLFKKAITNQQINHFHELRCENYKHNINKQSLAICSSNHDQNGFISRMQN